MLTVYIDQTDLPVEHDVENLFLRTRLKDTPVNRKLIEVIEKGTYKDESSFVDRFGYKLWKSELSTGCKAALCVANHPDKIIDTAECGFNARDAIINYCKEGNILYYDDGLTVAKARDMEHIDVVVNGEKCETVLEFNQYVQNFVEA